MTSARLRSNIQFLVVEQVVNYALPLLVLPFLFRVIGPEKFGRVAFAQAFVAFAAIVTDYGFNWSATRRIAQLANDNAAISRFASTVLTIKAAFMLMAFFVSALLVAVVPAWRGDAGLFAACFLSVAGSVMFPTWLFQGLQRMRELVALSLLGRAATVLAIFVLVRSEADYRIAAALLAANGIIAGLVSLVILTRSSELRWVLPARSDLSSALDEGWHLFVSNLSIALYSNTNVFVLGLLSSPVAVGQYAAAERIVRAVTTLLNPISQAAFPHVAGVAVVDPARALDINRNLVRLQGGVSLVASIALAVAAMPLVMIISGPQYDDAIALVRIMAALPLFIGLSNVFGVQTMLNFGMGKQFSQVLIFSGILNLVLLFGLVPALNAKGAAISVVVSEAAVTLVMASLLYREGLLRSLLGPRTWGG